MKLRFVIVTFLLSLTTYMIAQKIIPLYNGEIPNSTGVVLQETPWIVNGEQIGFGKISQPSLTIYLPPKETASHTAVIICPGGGYMFENYILEGTNIAEIFIKHGIAAFILKYRLPSDVIMKNKSIGPLQDGQQALKIVRQHAAEWNIDPDKIGIMGFSAGGHLASTAGTHFNKSYIPNPENTSLRPSFMILIYPVISMTDSLAHSQSRECLLGKDPSEKNKELFSNELQVNRQTPPTWLTHTGDDKSVSVINSIQFYEALIKNEVPAEMHLYPAGGHGFVLEQPTEEWMKPLFDWLKSSKWMN